MRTALLTSPHEVERNIKRLNSLARLSEKTVVKSIYEMVFKECLLEMGIGASYESFAVSVDAGRDRWQTYLPDFIIEKTLSGRNVVLEPHDVLRRTRAEVLLAIGKYTDFKQRYGSTLYFVLASDVDARLLERASGMPICRLSDEYWRLPTTRCGLGPIKRGVRSHLDSLMRR